MKITNYLWALPFICFIGTYSALSFFFTAPPIIAPSLIGKQLPQAITLLSSNNLNPRILQEQVDDDLPIGTILSQIPAPGQKIKPHQQLFITVSKKADKTAAPALVGKQYEHIVHTLKKLNIRHKAYSHTSKKPSGTIIAQLPESGKAIEHNSMILYVSSGNNKPVICPQFIGHTVEEIAQFLAVYSIQPQIYHTRLMHETHICAQCTVVNQQPLAGSILDLDKGTTIQLKVTDLM